MTGDDLGFAAGFAVGWILGATVVLHTVRAVLRVTATRHADPGPGAGHDDPGPG